MIKLIAGPVGYFGKTILKAMTDAGIGYKDVERLSGNKIPQTNIQRYCKNGTLPSTEVMRILADLLKLDFLKLRQFAARDYVDRVAAECQLKVSDIPGLSKNAIILPPEESASHTIAIYDSDALLQCLSRKGFPVRKSRSRLKSVDYGPHTYAILMKNELLHDHVHAGHYAVMAPEREMPPPTTDFGLAGYLTRSRKMAIAYGALYIEDSHVSVATLKPKFKTTWIPREDLLFVHALAAVILPDASLIVRVP